MRDKKFFNTKKLVVGIIIVAILLCIITVFEFIGTNKDFKLTYKDHTRIYRVEDLPWVTIPERTIVNDDGIEFCVVAGEYADVYSKIFRSIPIWGFSSITYITKDGSKIEYTIDEYYPHGSDDILVGDELRMEKDRSITALHYEYSKIYDDEQGPELNTETFMEINNVVEIVVKSADYRK